MRRDRRCDHPVSLLVGQLNLFLTTGFLPPLFRDRMRLPWSPCDQRRFDRLMRTLGAVNSRVPVALREAPYRLLMTDLRRRIRTGRPLV
ncbi:oxygenase MpaB family protein [Rhodococcus rhodochrous]|uniref:oxygenase MpaB family protein n=1 Tax=Rhodococcus rhodochrous TaxID=1829 RepID=UPI002379FFE4|nr:oxygenase MpaB family protein [Rhodococcus rhodochrous]